MSDKIEYLHRYNREGLESWWWMKKDDREITAKMINELWESKIEDRWELLRKKEGRREILREKVKDKNEWER